MITVKGTSGIVQNFNRYIKWFKVDLNRLTSQQADEGAMFLKEKMPSQTGEMINAVDVGGSGESNYSIRSRTPRNKDGRYRPYHIWYNAGARGGRLTANRSGKTRYYEKTYKYLSKKYPEKVNKELDKLLSKASGIKSFI